MKYYNYNVCLLDIAEVLTDMQKNLYNCIFQLAMTGELAEWNKTIEVGTTIKFSMDIFEACEDKNIQILVNLLKSTEQTTDSLVNINKLNK